MYEESERAKEETDGERRRRRRGASRVSREGGK